MNIKKKIKVKVTEDINKNLISVYSDSIAPKDIKDIFVTPLLSNEPENTARSDEKMLEDKDISLNDLLESNKNIVFIGKKEIGKTTIINYCCNYYLNKIDSTIMPAIIDFNELPKGKNIIQKAITNFYINYDIKDFNVDENVKHGNCLILLDNFNVDNAVNVEKLKDFMKQYPNNRIILTMNENILQSIKIKDLPDLGFEYSHYYIYSFRRGQIRQLVKNWFSNQNTNFEIILERIMLSIKNIGIPRTPMVISLMLWVLEKQENYIPVNESSLVENYIENLLEKLNPDDSKYESFGYGIKKDFLLNLAAEMLKSQKYNLDKKQFEEFFVSYFNKKGLDVKHDLKESFFEKGILLLFEDKVHFRFRCFFEYFIALSMSEYEDVYQFIISENKYLDFLNEITFYAGLNQKNQSYKLLKIFEERLIKSFEEIDKLINITEICELPVKEMLQEAVLNQDFSTKLEKMKLTDDEKDTILDSSSSVEYKDNDVQLISKSSTNKEEVFIRNLELYSKILKNCELVDIEPKIEALRLSINKFSIFTGLLYKVMYTMIHEKNNFDELKRGEKIVSDEELLYLITVGITIMIQAVIMNNLGTPKLKGTILESLKQDISDFERLLLTCLYGDMRLEGYVNKFDELLKSTNSNLIKEIIFNKLFYYQAFFTKSKHEEEQLINVISNYSIEKQKINKSQSNAAKSMLKQKLKHMSLIEQQKNRKIE